MQNDEIRNIISCCVTIGSMRDHLTIVLLQIAYVSMLYVAHRAFEKMIAQYRVMKL